MSIDCCLFNLCGQLHLARTWLSCQMQVYIPLCCKIHIKCEHSARVHVKHIQHDVFLDMILFHFVSFVHSLSVFLHVFCVTDRTCYILILQHLTIKNSTKIPYLVQPKNLNESYFTCDCTKHYHNLPFT